MSKNLHSQYIPCDGCGGTGRNEYDDDRYCSTCYGRKQVKNPDYVYSPPKLRCAQCGTGKPNGEWLGVKGRVACSESCGKDYLWENARTWMI